MKRLVLITFALLFLAACGTPAAEPAITTEPETTTATTETTTELETTTQELIELPERQEHEILLSETITIIEAHVWGISHEIWMRDETTGEETLLLEGNTYYSGVPGIVSRVSGRFFQFRWFIPDTCGISGVLFYDIEQRREIPIAWGVALGENGRIYVHCEVGQGIGVEPEDVPAEFFCLSALENDEALFFQCAGMNVAELWETLGLTIDGVWQHEES